MRWANVVLLAHTHTHTHTYIYIYRWAKGKELYTQENKAFYVGELPQVHFFGNDGPIKLAPCKNKKIELERHFI
jgi:hypothetical protein